jgi:hypothetical protein
VISAASVFWVGFASAFVITHDWQSPQVVMNVEFCRHEVAELNAAISVLHDA